jgi:hypothetical protein
MTDARVSSRWVYLHPFHRYGKPHGDKILILFEAGLRKKPMARGFKLSLLIYHSGAFVHNLFSIGPNAGIQITCIDSPLQLFHKDAYRHPSTHLELFYEKNDHFRSGQGPARHHRRRYPDSLSNRTATSKMSARPSFRMNFPAYSLPAFPKPCLEATCTGIWTPGFPPWVCMYMKSGSQKPTIPRRLHKASLLWSSPRGRTAKAGGGHHCHHGRPPGQCDQPAGRLQRR